MLVGYDSTDADVRVFMRYNHHFVRRQYTNIPLALVQYSIPSQSCFFFFAVNAMVRSFVNIFI